MEYGELHGSKLDPSLLLWFINDLPNILDKFSIHLFADDAIIYLKGKKGHEILEQINRELESVCE